MKLNAELLEAYQKCPTKCWLRSQGETGQGNEYAEWVKRENQAYREAGVRLLLETVPEGERAIAPSGDGIKTAKWRLAVDITVQVPCTTNSESVAGRATVENGMTGQPTTAGTEPGAQPDPWFIESALDAVERVPPERRGKAAQFIPIRFIYRNKLTKEDRLLLAFDAFVLGQALARDIGVGKIVHGDSRAPLKVKTAPLASEVRKRAEKIVVLLGSPTAPDLVLNRHCGECEYRDQCRQKAIEKDDLSLLAGISAKERQKLRSKGIFTVTQLSYTFRPRRRPKRLRDKREKYHHALKALAIREKKIHVVGSPELKIEGTPVYLDVEGLPDREFYYLIGLRIGNGDSAVQHSLWADTVADEGKIWREFLGILGTVEKPVLIHYGSYETTFFKRMKERYGGPGKSTTAAGAIASAINLLSFVFGRIYFPAHSNRLKELGAFSGARWNSSPVSGLQAIAWRLHWEKAHDSIMRCRLLTYNQDDCAALDMITAEVLNLIADAKTRPDVDFADTPKNSGSDQAVEIHRMFSAVLRSAYSDYSKSKVVLAAPKRLFENAPHITLTLTCTSYCNQLYACGAIHI